MDLLDNILFIVVYHELVFFYSQYIVHFRGCLLIREGRDRGNCSERSKFCMVQYKGLTITQQVLFLLLFWFVFLDKNVVLHILGCTFCASRLLLLVCCKKVEHFIVHNFRYIFFTIIYRLLFCKFYGCYCCYHYLQSHYCNSHHCSYHQLIM